MGFIFAYKKIPFFVLFCYFVCQKVLEKKTKISWISISDKFLLVLIDCSFWGAFPGKCLICCDATAEIIKLSPSWMVFSVRISHILLSKFSISRHGNFPKNFFSSVWALIVMLVHNKMFILFKLKWKIDTILNVSKYLFEIKAISGSVACA